MLFLGVHYMREIRIHEVHHVSRLPPAEQLKVSKGP